MPKKTIYQIHAELQDYEPKIWRRFYIASDTTMAKLGYAVLSMFEMQGNHLFCIRTSPDTTFEVLSEFSDEFAMDEVLDATSYSLNKGLRKGEISPVVEYDYGDGWEVRLVVEQVIKDVEISARDLPCVLEGEGYGIVEDCGGPGGLVDLAEAFAIKKGPQYKSFCQWLGVSDFDLSTFRLSDVNERLRGEMRLLADAYEKGGAW